MAAVVQYGVELPKLIDDGLQELGVDLTANPNVDLLPWVVESLGLLVDVDAHDHGFGMEVAAHICSEPPCATPISSIRIGRERGSADS